MKVILEGPDNSGKTTLANTIKGDHIYFHPGGPPENATAEVLCTNQQAHMLGVENGSIVMDRCTPISQLVYSPDRTMDVSRWARLEAYKRIGILFVYCRPSTDALMSFEHFTWRDGETEEHKQKIIRGQHAFIQRYDEVMLKIPHVHYDFGSGIEAVHLQSRLLQALNGDKESEMFLRNLTAHSRRSA